MKKRIVGISLLSCMLLACGGGGSGGSTPTVTPTPNPTPPPVQPDPSPSTPGSISVEGKDSVTSNESVGLVALLDGSSQDYDFVWQQTSGPDVALLSNQSQVLGFDVPEAGSYSFTVTATHQNTGDILQTDFDFNASDALSSVGIRLDHAVAERAKVSLRADALPGVTVTAINWQQVSGIAIPDENIPDTTSSPLFYFFDAPSVEQDELLQFRATMTLEDGSNVTDDVYVLIKDVEISDDGFFPSASERIVSAEMHPYNPESEWADALESCIYNNVVASSCTFSTLPLLGQVTTTPTVQDVMDRVYVSHDWMGDRLKSYLENSIAAPDMLSLLRGVTAIVISYEVRPSFYWVATGAIYLDAANFWVSPEERDTLNDQPDFRANFGRELQFIMPWRYVRNGQDYLRRSNYPIQERNSRTFADVEADITWLMYHELAHANDFFPPARWSNIPMSSSPLSYFRLMPPDSDSFAALFPLLSDELKALAQVSFRGLDATTAQRNTTADEVADMFSGDSGVMYYSYSTEREDYATLFERFMMSHRFGAQGDVAVMVAPEQNEDLLVAWGQRSRVNDPKLQARTRHVVNNILPELNAEAIQATLPQPRLMRTDRSWFDNINLDENRAERSTNKHSIHSWHNGQMPHYMLHHVHPGRPGIPKSAK